MKYLGEKSLSSVLNILLNIIFYISIVVSVIFMVILFIIMFIEPVTDPNSIGINQLNYKFFHEFRSDNKVWEMQKFPLLAKIFILPYVLIVIGFIINIIRKSQQFFKNLRNNVVFIQTNVELLQNISKMVIIVSIMTLDFGSILIGLILLVLTEIFKNGTVLQEEQDLTV